MARVSPFTVLGKSQNAIKLIGTPETFKVSLGAHILAANKPHSETIVSGGPAHQLNVIDKISKLESWRLDQNIVLAEHDSFAALMTSRGVYRVDVGHGSEFICDPKRLVGTLGVLHTSIVYTESRVDVALAWAKAIRQGIASSFHRVYESVNPLYRRVLASSLVQKIPKPQTRILPQLPPAPEQLKRLQRFVVTFSKHASQFIRQRTFYLTHTPKVRVEGPCSVLVRG